MPSNKKRPKKSSTKVIHVAFGSGGGRITPPEATSDEQGSIWPEPSAKEPVADVYTQAEVSRLLGVPKSRLRALDKARVVSPSGRRRGRRAYTFNDLIALRAARDMLSRRMRTKKVAEAVARLRELLPRVARPLHELRIASDGKEIVVHTSDGVLEPTTGQMVLDFDVRQLHEEVVRMLRPQAGPERSRLAYDLYLKASQLDDDPDTMDQAEAIYREALKHDPWLAILYTNLGNIRFRSADEAEAAELYRKALEIEPSQPEAQYNLGYMMLHRHQLEEAITYFEGAIASDSRFADAYFNLAMAYEQLCDIAKAKSCWRNYLEIEPEGAWSDIARQHLED